MNAILKAFPHKETSKKFQRNTHIHKIPEGWFDLNYMISDSCSSCFWFFCLDRFLPESWKILPEGWKYFVLDFH